MKTTYLLVPLATFVAQLNSCLALPKSDTAVLPIKARVGITNNWPDPLRVETNGQHNIDKKFPDPLLIPPGETSPNPEAVVSASWAPLASSFALTFYTPSFSTVEVQLGKLGYKTTTLFAPANAPYELVTLFAPQKPLSFVTDVDTHLHILSGPGKFPPMVNQIASDAIPQLNSYLSSTPPTITVTKGVTLTISGAPGSIVCEYATLDGDKDGVIKPSPNGTYRITAVINVNGNLTGSFSVPAIKLNDKFDVSVMNLRVLLRVNLDVASGAMPKPSLAGLQVAVDGLKLSSPTSKAITALWPAVAAVLGLPNSLAGYLNTELNAKVLSFANSQLDRIGGNLAVTLLRAAQVNILNSTLV